MGQREADSKLVPAAMDSYRDRLAEQMHKAEVDVFAVVAGLEGLVLRA